MHGNIEVVLLAANLPSTFDTTCCKALLEIQGCQP